MGLLSLTYSKAAYRADFAFYGALVPALAALLIVYGPRAQALEFVALTLAGLAGWTLIEYLMHRFVLHGLLPFSRWHATHHQQPKALTGAPTVLSATLIAALVFLPMLLAGDFWYACALTLGVLAGYFAYSVTHHATHHWHGDGAWLRRRRRWHALHHHRAGPPGRYGVTTAFWDHVFRTAGQVRRPHGDKAGFET